MIDNIDILPIYEAVFLEKDNVPGGTTLPCQMTVVDKNENLKGVYIVKVFGQRHIEQYNPTNKEIIANILAQAFEIKVPSLALVEVPLFIIEEMKQNPVYGKSELKAGYYYGCAYIENTASYEAGLETNTYETWELATIFAFDVLIRNFDRRTQKPNILFKEQEFILIDHDLALDLTKDYAWYKSNQTYQKVVKGVKGEHIFLKHLKAVHEVEKITFDDFIMDLRGLDFKELDKAQKVLEMLDMDTSDFEVIKEYLKSIQADSTNFQQLLIALIQT
ncbi:MAG: HipA family kinase [Saprospiraceae bacterium]